MGWSLCVFLQLCPAPGIKWALTEYVKGNLSHSGWPVGGGIPSRYTSLLEVGTLSLKTPIAIPLRDSGWAGSLVWGGGWTQHTSEFQHPKQEVYITWEMWCA